MHSQESASSVGLWPTLLWGFSAYLLLVIAQVIAAAGLAVPAIGPDAKEMAQDPVFAARALALSFYFAAPLLWILVRAATRKTRNRNAYLGLGPAPLKSYGVALLLSFGLLGLSVGLDAYFDRPPIHAFAMSIYEAATGFWILPVLGSLVLLGPFFEELLYRGLLLAGFSHSALGPYGASLLVAVLFAGSHFQYEPIYLVQVFVLGLILCGLRIRYTSIWPPFFLHALNNLGAWLFALLNSVNTTS